MNKIPKCPVCKSNEHVVYKEIDEPFNFQTMIGSKVNIIDSYFLCKKCGIRFEDISGEDTDE